MAFMEMETKMAVMITTVTVAIIITIVGYENLKHDFL
jgi:hypothetical protein